MHLLKYSVNWVPRKRVIIGLSNSLKIEIHLFILILLQNMLLSLQKKLLYIHFRFIYLPEYDLDRKGLTDEVTAVFLQTSLRRILHYLDFLKDCFSQSRLSWRRVIHPFIG